MEKGYYESMDEEDFPMDDSLPEVTWCENNNITIDFERNGNEIRVTIMDKYGNEATATGVGLQTALKIAINRYKEEMRYMK